MKRIKVAAYPVGALRRDDLVLETVDQPTPGPGELLLETIWLSIDPATRLAINQENRSPLSIKLGDPVKGPVVSRVAISNTRDYAAGDFVTARLAWSDYNVVDPKTAGLRKLDPTLAPISTALGVLGSSGQTAHACMIEIGRVTAGETVIVSAAAGAVGLLAGQIGKILGARVVGIAGGANKCARVEELGFDACVDYRADDFAERLAAACPGGADVYVENVGGRVTDVALQILKYGARMPVSGFVAYYEEGTPPSRPDRLPDFMRLAMAKGLEMRAFASMFVTGPAVFDDLATWLRQGRIRHPQTIVEGLENAPAALAAIFSGNDSVGKVIVRVADG